VWASGVWPLPGVSDAFDLNDSTSNIGANWTNAAGKTGQALGVRGGRLYAPNGNNWGSAVWIGGPYVDVAVAADLWIETNHQVVFDFLDATSGSPNGYGFVCRDSAGTILVDVYRFDAGTDNYITTFGSSANSYAGDAIGITRHVSGGANIFQIYQRIDGVWSNLAGSGPTEYAANLFYTSIRFDFNASFGANTRVDNWRVQDITAVSSTPVSVTDTQTQTEGTTGLQRQSTVTDTQTLSEGTSSIAQVLAISVSDSATQNDISGSGQSFDQVADANGVWYQYKLDEANNGTTNVPVHDRKGNYPRNIWMQANNASGFSFGGPGLVGAAEGGTDLNNTTGDGSEGIWDVDGYNMLNPAVAYPAHTLSGGFAISAYYMFPSWATGDKHITMLTNETTYGVCGLAVVSGGQPWIYYYSPSIGNYVQAFGGAALSPNTVYRLTGIYNPVAATLTMYVNGVQWSQTTSAPAPQDGEHAAMLISGLWGGAGRAWGEIDDVRYYFRALTPAEDLAEYNAGISGAGGPPIGAASTVTDTQTESDSSSVSVAGPTTINGTDTATQTEGTTGLQQQSTVTDTQTQTEGTTALVQTDTRSVTDSQTQTEGTTGLQQQSTVTDTQTQTEGTTAAAITATVVDTQTQSEGTTTTAQTAQISVVDSWALTEGASSLSTTLSAVDSWALTDISALSQAYSANDSATQSEEPTAISITAAVVDDWDLTDTSAISIAGTVTDSATQSEATPGLQAQSTVIDAQTEADTSSVAVQTSAVDSWTLSDASQLATSMTPSVSDSFSTVDTSGVAADTSASDPSTAGDSSAVSAATAASDSADTDEETPGIALSTTDAQTQSAASSYSAALSASDTQTTTDSSALVATNFVTVSDVWAVSDVITALSAQVSAVDDWQVLETDASLGGTSFKSVTDDFEQDEGVPLITSTNLLSLTDTQTESDSATYSAAASVSDSATQSDASILAAELALSVSDQAALSEAVSAAVSAAATDTWTLSETGGIGGTAFKTANDDLALSDSSAVFQTLGLAVVDALTLLEVAALEQRYSASDTLTASEVAAIADITVKTALDSAALTEQAQAVQTVLNLLAQETITLGEVVSLAAELAASDTQSEIDEAFVSAAAFFNRSDDFTVDEDAQLTTVQYITILRAVATVTARISGMASMESTNGYSSIQEAQTISGETSVTTLVPGAADVQEV